MRAGVIQYSAGQVRVIEVAGDVDVSNAEEFVDILLAAAAQPQARVVVDFQRAQFIDSTVLNALFTAARRLRAHDGRLAIVCNNPHLERVLEASGIDARFPVVESPERALEVLESSPPT